MEFFLPSYPFLKEPTFEQSLFQKKELRDLTLDAVESKPSAPGTLMKHQALVARFLSAFTPYAGLLLFWEMGAGKSCAVFGAVELNRSQAPGLYARAIIITRGKGLIDNLIRELVFVCTPRTFLPSETTWSSMNENQRNRYIRKKMTAFYHFTTYVRFSKVVSTLTPDEIKAKYSNTIFIVDEVHHIRDKEEEQTMDPPNLDVYSSLHTLFHTVTNSKVILLTGTPMRDQPYEIADCMNLLLPLEHQMPVQHAFRNAFLDADGNVRESAKETLRSFFRGYVYYVRAIHEPLQFKGELLGTLEYTRVVPVVMSPFQSEVYMQVYESEQQIGQSEFYHQSREATLFIFPDKSFGSEGYKQNMVKRNKVLQFKPTVLSELKPSTLSMYSALYDTVIRSFQPSMCAMVYLDIVHGSGLLVFTKCMELMGYSAATGKETTRGKRYALLSAEKSSDMDRLMTRFNQLDNWDGSFIQVICGSRVMGEGLSFLHIQQIHVLFPFWNYAETIQAIYRGIRLDSLREVRKHRPDAQTMVSQYVTIPMVGSHPQFTSSIQYYMYQISEKKDKGIKQLERLLKESSVVCALTYARNVKPTDVDFSRECDYQKCAYTCSGITPERFVEDTTTYQLYYASEANAQLQKQLVGYFQRHASTSLDELQRQFPGYSKFQLLCSLYPLIHTWVPIMNSFGFPCVLKEQNDMYFLVRSPSYISSLDLVYYTQHPTISMGHSFSDIVTHLEHEKAWEMIEELVQHPEEYSSETMESIPRDLQSSLLETLFWMEQESKQTSTPFRHEALFQRFRPHVVSLEIEHQGIRILSTFLHEEGVYRCFEEGEWRDCTEEEAEAANQYLSTRRTDLDTHPFGYYGIQDASGSFCIKDLQRVVKGKKYRIRKQCMNWEMDQLLHLIHKASLSFPPSPPCRVEDIRQNKFASAWYDALSEPERAFLTPNDLCRIMYWSNKRKKELCQGLSDWFTERNMMIQEKC